MIPSSLTTKWINFNTFKVMHQPRHLSATSLLRTLHSFPVNARVQYKVAYLFSVSVTICHHIFLTFIHTILLGCSAPLTFLCWQFFAPLLRPLVKGLCFGPTVRNSLPLSLRKTKCFSTFKKNLKTHFFEIYLCCLQVQVYACFCVPFWWWCWWWCGVVWCVCVCVCVCVCDVWYG